MFGSSRSVDTKQEKPDRTDGLGNEIEIANYALQQKQLQDENIEKTVKETSKTETNDNGQDKNDANKESKKGDVQSRSSSSFSLNSRRKKDEPVDRPKDRESLDDDIETAVHAHYMTDDMKHGSSSEREDEGDDSKSPAGHSKIHWKEDESKNTNRTKSEEKDKGNSDVSKESVRSDTKESATKDRPKSSSSSSSDHSEKEKPHLVTTYRKPTTSSGTTNDKPNQPNASKSSKPDNAKTSNRRYLSQSARYPQKGQQTPRDSRPTSSRATSRTSRSIPSRPRTTLGFSTGDFCF